MAISDFQDVYVLQVLATFWCDQETALRGSSSQDVFVIELTCEVRFLQQEAN